MMMMQVTIVLSLFLLIALVTAFTPSTNFNVRSNGSCTITTSNTICYAKHANDKAAKWAASKRPKKHRLSDIHRKPIIYELTSIIKPSEYTIDPAEPVLAVKVTKTE